MQTNKSKILVVKKEIDDTDLWVGYVNDISNKNIIAKELGFTYDEMYSDEMKDLLEIFNKYTYAWVYRDEDSHIEDKDSIPKLKQELEEYIKSNPFSNFAVQIIPILNFAIENNKTVFFAF